MPSAAEASRVPPLTLLQPKSASQRLNYCYTRDASAALGMTCFFHPPYLSSQLLNTFTFSRLTSTWASGAAGLSTVCRRELV